MSCKRKSYINKLLNINIYLNFFCLYMSLYKTLNNNEKVLIIIAYTNKSIQFDENYESSSNGVLRLIPPEVKHWILINASDYKHNHTQQNFHKLR